MKSSAIYFFTLMGTLGACSTSQTSIEGERPASIDSTPIIFERNGFGIFIDDKSINFGWLNETKIQIPQGRCQVVIISKNISEIQRLLEISGGRDSLNNICLLKDIK